MDRTGWQEALRRIEAEGEARTGALDLSGLGLRALPPALGELTWLESLNLGAVGKGLSGHLVQQALSLPAEVREQILETNPLHDLAPLRRLKALRALDCSGTTVSDLGPLRRLGALVDLNLALTPIVDLTPLAGLGALRTLALPNTAVVDLRPLGRIGSLTSLSLRRTAVSSLGPLEGLGQLTSLDCGQTPVSDLSPLAEAGALAELKLSQSAVIRLEPLAGLGALRLLDVGDTRVSDLSPLSGLVGLETLRIDGCPVSDLGPLARMAALRTVRCAGTAITDLSPLAGLPALETLDIQHTKVVDLGPLARVSTLTTVHCSSTGVSKLEPLASSTGMRSLYCSYTDVSDLGPLGGFSRLEELLCSGTGVADLKPLAGLATLRTLNCTGTRVADLSPLKAATALDALYCNGTLVSDLSPVAALPALSALGFGRTAVRDISPLAALPSLTFVSGFGCALDELPLGLLRRESLEWLVLSRVDSYPPEVLSPNEITNCLPSLRAHIADLEAGTEPVRTTKVIVLGNGRVGKTQLCRRLRGLDYDPSIPSTHGIVIETAPFDDDETLNLWDFGGQDIYHGAHALFMRTRAVFVIAWHPDFEDAPTHEHQGMTFRNRPLAYWLAFVRAMSAPGSPVIVLQARCESRAQAVKRLPVPDELLDDLDCRTVAYGAANNHGRRRLDTEIADAIEALRERDGVASIGKGRARIIEALEALRAADQARPPAEREHRVIQMPRFVEMCEEAGGVSSPAALLSYLHHCGLLFYDAERFEGRILLDISWALEAVYALFDRETAWRQLQGTDGRFTLALLGATAWREQPIETRRLFLHLMLSCGICFRHGDGSDESDDTAEYVAPDLLPPRQRVQRHLQGRMQGPTRRLVQRYAFLHPGLFRGLMSRIGGRAGEAGVYWRGGLWVHVPRSKAQVQIQVIEGEGYSGQIEIAMIGDDGELAEWLRRQLGEQSRRFGLMALDPEVDELPRRVGEPRARVAAACEDAVEPAAPSFGPMAPEEVPRPSPDRPRVYISYARGDGTAQADRGAALTRALHGALADADVEVTYDELATGFGDSIGAFMNDLIEGDRVVLVLGEKYLRSPFCMYELYGLWQRARGDAEAFRGRVLPLLLPGTRIDTIQDRLEHAGYWLKQYQEIDGLLAKIGPGALAPGDLADLKRMQEYRLHVGDILRLLSDTLMPRDLDGLTADGFAPLRALLGLEPPAARARVYNALD